MCVVFVVALIGIKNVQMSTNFCLKAFLSEFFVIKNVDSYITGSEFNILIQNLILISDAFAYPHWHTPLFTGKN
jgi:hypothetical protein